MCSDMVLTVPTVQMRKHGAATSCEDSPAVDASAPSHHVFSGVGPRMYAPCGSWLPHQHAAYSMATSRAAVCCFPSRGSEVSKAASSVALSALCCMLLHAHVWQLCVHRAWLLMCRLQQIVRVAIHVTEGYISSRKFRLRPHDWGQGQGC